MIVDPPEGWKYGFPKEMPDHRFRSLSLKSFRDWFVENGYPQSLIDQGMLYHMRYWESPE
jgi:hypothetical protein